MFEKKAFALAILLLIVGGLAWGLLAATGKNVVAKTLGKRAWLVYALVGISALLVLFVGRNAFLPFLGPTVFPCGLLEDKVPEGADTTVEVLVKPGAKVLYWGAEPANEVLKKLPTWKEAYGPYKNVGVTTADEEGIATLRLRSPQPYTVPTKGRLESHVHYRICLKDGWMSQVETKLLATEAFQDVPNSNPVTTTTTTPTPNPTAPIIPVLAQSPELPVIADPVSGLPTAVPAAVVTSSEKKEQPATATTATATETAIPNATLPGSQTGAETPSGSAIEGFANEILYGSTAEPTGFASLNQTVEKEDARLLRLRTQVETTAIQMSDTMGFQEGPYTQGTELDAAFQPTLKPAKTNGPSPSPF